VQAAGLQHPNEITAAHIVRRTAQRDVRLLSNQLSIVKPGELLAAIEGLAAWPHRVYEYYWPMASAHSFQPDMADAAFAGRSTAQVTAAACP
jgi:hypothetical protein